MQNKAWQTYLVIILLLSILVGCNNHLPDEIPDIGIPQSEVNTRIRLFNVGDQRLTVKNKDLLSIGVEVNPNDRVAFDQSFGVRLFAYIDKQWIEIENYVEFPEGNDNQIILPPSDGWLIKTSIADVSPNVENLGGQVPVRVFVIGKLLKDGKITDERTAAFIDILVKP